MALILRRAQTIAVNTVVVTRAHTALLPVSNVALLTFASVRAVRVVTDGVLVAVVQPQAALVHVGTLRVRPAGVGGRYVQQRGAVDVRTREVTFRANAVDRVFVRVTPTATHTPEAGRTLRLRLTRLALACFFRRLAGRRGGAIEPLPAESELIFTRVDAEAEALAGGLAPDAAAALVEAVLAVEAHAAGRGALARLHHGAARAPAPRAPRLVRPPLAVVAGHAPLAAYVIRAIRTRSGLQSEVPPFFLGRADHLLVGVSQFAAIRQLAPATRGV